MNLSLSNILIGAIMLLTIMPVHEYAHAWAADKLGDGSARLSGRMTLNPFAHLDVHLRQVLALHVQHVVASSVVLLEHAVAVRRLPVILSRDSDVQTTHVRVNHLLLLETELVAPLHDEVPGTGGTEQETVTRNTHDQRHASA